jgi:hypothetical protein
MLKAVVITACLGALLDVSTACGNPTTRVAQGDRVPPQVLAMSSVVRLTPQVRLQYRIWDDSGHAFVTAEVRRGSSILRRTSLGKQRIGFHYWYWAPPKAGDYKFCVSASDTAGNKSRVACTLLKILAPAKG